MKIKRRQFTVIDELDIENRVNEELAGWKIKKIITLDITPCGEYICITLIGEVDEKS